MHLRESNLSGNDLRSMNEAFEVVGGAVEEIQDGIQEGGSISEDAINPTPDLVRERTANIGARPESSSASWALPTNTR